MNLTFSFLIWITTFVSLHPIHLAITHVDFNPKSGSLEITHKIFIDDFELALKLYDNEAFQLGTEREVANADQFIKKYIEKQFQLKVDGKEVYGEYVGRESDLEAIWIYQEVKNVGKAEAIELDNNILLDLYDDQKNILHLKYGAQKQSFLFRKDQTVEKMEIEQ